MTFNFDGGDILVILLVTIVLYLFHRFDRTGRSLEKVRRYADKSKNDLDAIVAERELGLKDLSVDLEVQEKTNREILSRAEAAQGEIISRTQELEGRVERIEAHEKALEELNDLALRVDENLARLKKESTYVDKVGSRISEVKTSFSEMAEKDVSRFESFKAEMIGQFDEDLQRMRSGVDETNRQMLLFQENLENLNARRDDTVSEKLFYFRDELERTEGDFRERLKKIVEGGSQLEDEAFNVLNEKIESRKAGLESNWLTGINELKDQFSETANEMQDLLATTRQDMEGGKKEFREIEERVRETSGALDKAIKQMHGKVDDFVEDKESILLETVEVRQNEYRK